jgi:hypothetical protein
MQAKLILKLIALFALLNLALLELGCQKEIASGNKKGMSMNRSDCALFVSFDMETTTVARTVNDADYALLEPIDRIAAMPHRERFAVEVCYKDTGQKEFSMTRMKPLEPIVYPNNASDGYLVPDFSRLVVANGVATYYDQFDNVMRTKSQASDILVVQDIADMMANRKPLTDAEFEQGLQIMQNGGLVMQNHSNNLVTIRHDFPDGSYSIQALDKTTRVAVGNLHFGPNGQLQTRSVLDVEGSAQSPVIKRSFVESFMVSMIGNIPMKVERYATFDNFALYSN